MRVQMLCAMVAVLAWVPGASLAGGGYGVPGDVPSLEMEPNVPAEDVLKLEPLTDDLTSKLEIRLVVPIAPQWEAGPLVTWFAEDDPDTEWGAGGFLRHFINPATSIPLNDWLPEGVGDLLNLPDTLTGRGYLIGKLQVLPYDDSPQLAGAIGPGLTVEDILVMEYVYNIVESRTSADPLFESGPELWIGAQFKWEF